MDRYRIVHVAPAAPPPIRDAYATEQAAVEALAAVRKGVPNPEEFQLVRVRDGDVTPLVVEAVPARPIGLDISPE